MSYRSLPLFPLNTVLFPNASLPLQIFEERYKIMLDECLESDSQFGVVLILEGSEVGGLAMPHDVGTVARIVQVDRIDENRLFVLSVGVRRFRVLTITQREPFLVADVEILDETGPLIMEPSDDLVEEAVTTFSDYARAAAGMAGGWVRRTRVPSDPVALSYHIAHSMQVDLPDKQRLLEHESAARRLMAEIDILKRAYAGLRRRMAAELMSRFSRQ